MGIIKYCQYSLQKATLCYIDLAYKFVQYNRATVYQHKDGMWLIRDKYRRNNLSQSMKHAMDATQVKIRQHI